MTNFATSFPIFEKNKELYSWESSASRRFSWNIKPYFLFWKSSKIWNCRLLQIVGGVLRVNAHQIKVRKGAKIRNQYNQVQSSTTPDPGYQWESFLFNGEQKNHNSSEDGIEKYVPHDHLLSSLGKPRDAKRWFSGGMFHFHPHNHDTVL